MSIEKYDYKRKPKFNFNYNGYKFKYVEGGWHATIYIDDIEIGRSHSLFSIPFIQINKIKGSFIGSDGQVINVLLSWPQMPILAKYTVYFDGIEVFNKMGTA